MINFDNVLNAYCKQNMVEFDLTKFKKDYPKLYASIVGSMMESFSMGINKSKTENVMIGKKAIEKRLKDVN